MTIQQISSAIYNNVVTGLAGINSNPKISIEQLEDEVVAERNHVIKEYLAQGLIGLDELYLAIDCIDVDCQSMIKCDSWETEKKVLHFEIPQIYYLNGVTTIKYIGSVDRKTRYKIYTDESYRFHKYKKRGSKSPYVFVDVATNKNGNLDCYIFNLNYAKVVSIIALFLDPRKVLDWECCADNYESYLDCGLISNEIIKRLTEKYIRWYKQLGAASVINDQIPR